MRRAFVIVLDACGVGALPDAASYGDSPASNTLEHVAALAGGLDLPVLGALGLGCVEPLDGVAPVPDPVLHGRVGPLGPGKESVTGHWELMGVVPQLPLPTYPDGFPDDVVRRLEQATGARFCCNRPYSGTQVIDDFGSHHLRSGELILYTSADSVLQIAAHEEVVPLDELYRICEAARAIADRHRIGRVIARPFVGRPGAFRRTYNRRDYALVPPAPTLLDHLVDAGQEVIGIGKISDIFAGRGISRSLHSEGNADGLRLTLEALPTLERGLLFVNLVDFDMLYGHRNDVPGFARALAELDAWLPAFEAALGPGDVAFLTADHGNDPTTPGTDHTRERVPLLAFGPGVRAAPLGARASFCDLGQTIAVALGLAPIARGTSFLDALAG
jgi:phosphopentomutase